jgi:hypothetical protein
MLVRCEYGFKTNNYDLNPCLCIILVFYHLNEKSMIKVEPRNLVLYTVEVKKKVYGI